MYLNYKNTLLIQTCTFTRQCALTRPQKGVLNIVKVLKFFPLFKTIKLVNNLASQMCTNDTDVTAIS